MNPKVTFLVVLFAVVLFVGGWIWFLWQDAKAMLLDVDGRPERGRRYNAEGKRVA